MKIKPPYSTEKPVNIPWPAPSLWNFLFWFLLVIIFFQYGTDFGKKRQQALSYSEFKEQVQTKQVVEITLQGDKISGVLQSGSVNNTAATPPRFTTVLPPIADSGLMPLLEQHNVKIKAVSGTGIWWVQALINIVPWLLIIGFFWYASSKMRERLGGDGMFGFGKSRARRVQKGESEVTFNEVAGLENAKSDLREITSYLKNPEHYRKLGAKIPKGILLMGPPGTGKTLLARAMAGEAGVTFFSISGSEFIEMFVGVGASRVRDMFESAKKEAPAIIFIDEIDSVGRVRGSGLGGGHDEREQTLNQILGEMDGFDPHEAVVVLAATNRPDVLDPALLRPGRFDRKVTLDLPDKKARIAILGIHSRQVPLTTDVDIAHLASITVGFSGADLENLINEAALHAGHQDKSEVDMASLLDARDKIVLGSRREMMISDKEKKLVAYHEAGHAVTASLLPNADPLDKVTIIPRGRALGATELIPAEEHHNLQQSYLRDRIAVMLGGRVSEELTFNEVSSGAEADLKQATSLARHMVAHWGMSEKLGAVAFHRGEEHIFLGREMAQQRDYSEHTAEVIDTEIGSLLRSIEGEVIFLLKKHQHQVKALAEALLAHETLEADEIQEILSQADNQESSYHEK